MERFVKTQGMFVVEKFVGHGIGQDMHEEPQVPNFVSKELRKKDIKLDQVFITAEKCRRHGVAVLFNLIVGFPEES